MSHFTVLVAAKDEADLERVLRPYHEYECTGYDDYTERLPVNLSGLEEKFEKYVERDEEGKPTQTMLQFALDWHGYREEDIDNDGVCRRQSNHKLYAWRNSVGRIIFHSYGVAEVPGTSHPRHTETFKGRDGETEIEEKRTIEDELHLNVDDPAVLLDFLNLVGGQTSKALFEANQEAAESLKPFIFPMGAFRGEDLSGPLQREFIKGAKWDWYSVGGRWTGLLHLKPEAVGQGKNGSPGLLTQRNARPDRADIVRAGQVDWDSMRQKQIDNVVSEYDEWAALPSDPDERQKAIRANDNLMWMNYNRRQDLESGISRVDYIEKYGREYGLTFAFIDQEGRWHERANMGWFAMTWNDNENFDSQWWRFVRGLPEDAVIFNVDCHI